MLNVEIGDGGLRTQGAQVTNAQYESDLDDSYELRPLQLLGPDGISLGVGLEGTASIGLGLNPLDLIRFDSIRFECNALGWVGLDRIAWS